MDLAGIAAVLGIPLLAISTFFSIAKERNQAATLERLQNISARLPEGTAQRVIIDDVIRASAFRLGLTALQPRYLISAWFGWAFIVSGSLFITLAIIFDPDIPRRYIAAAGLALGAGYLLLALRTGFLSVWRRKEQNHRLIDEPSMSLLPIRKSRTFNERLEDIEEAVSYLSPVNRWTYRLLSRNSHRTQKVSDTD